MTSPSIVLLDQETIGQIAAGEVIERPSSVVKELVENAVDAGATRIDVALEQGGIAEVTVTDDGAGIEPSELELAVRRHATSKLAGAEDLEFIATLGFRGEGLASIAAVCNLEIVSRRASEETGAFVRVHGETVEPVQRVASPTGTRVCARDLFRSVPARREFLRSPATEFSRVSGWLSSFALAYPHVTFSLHHDGREIWVVPATSDSAARLPLVFGKSAAQALIPIAGDAVNGWHGSVRGYVSVPGEDRPDRRMQLLFVNGRLLRSTMLSGAWNAGYATFAMTGRQPYGVLFLDVPPQHVDPNVHPTKSDVRLRFSTQAFDAVKKSIAQTLHAHAARRFTAAAAISAAPPQSAEQFAGWAMPLAEFSDDAPQALRVLAQLDKTYILATDGSAAILVDQHAAHERIAYESIAAAANAARPGEPLLVPLTLELDAAQYDALSRVLPALHEAGVEIEPFGDRAFRLVAAPSAFDAHAIDLHGFIGELMQRSRERDVREAVWASIACHSVVRAGESLEHAEMTTLIARLQRCRNPMHCPHGRPTIVRLEAPDLAKLFKR